LFNPVEKPFNPSGRFIATIAATDQKYVVYNAPKPAAFGVVILAVEGGAVIAKDSQPVPSESADENEALVLAVHHLLRCSDAKSRFQLRSSSTYIVETINERLANWKAKGWLNNQGKTPSYIKHWIEIERLMDDKSITIEAVHVNKDLAARDLAFQYAKELAIEARDIHGREIGSPLSGFGLAG
jgi:ribonuclease HI